MKEYTITVRTESKIIDEVVVEAHSELDAIRKVKKMYRNELGHVIFDSERYSIF